MATGYTGDIFMDVGNSFTTGPTESNLHGRYANVGDDTHFIPADVFPSTPAGEWPCIPRL